MAWVAIGSMLVSAALSHQANQSAEKKRQREAQAMRQRQLGAQNEATREASTKAAEFDPGNRRQQQADIEQALTGELEQQVARPQVTAQGVEVGTTINGGSQDYTVAKARETAKTTASLRELAALMGRIGSAGQLRQKEAIGIGDTAGAIGRIQNGAGNMAQIDTIGINAIQPNPVAMLASEALSAYGQGAFGMKKPLHGSAGGNPQFPEHGMKSGPTGAWL